MFNSTATNSQVDARGNIFIGSGNTNSPVSIVLNDGQGRDKERSKILKWLSRVPFKDHHSFVRSVQQDGTGKWLLEKQDFINWKDSTSSSILWLRGNGKSLVIDKFEIEGAKSRQQAIAYFYCSHGEKDRQDPVSILSTLVKQLSLIVSPEGSLPKSVVSIFKKHESNSGKLQLSESQELIATLTENFIQTTIVIDALDECDKESRKELLTALEVIMKSSAGVIKIFVTSRPADDIELKLEGVLNVYIHSSDNSEDIAAFVRAKIDKSISEKLLLRGSVTSELKESVIEKLTKGADGMFLWVSLQIKSICDEKTPRAIDKVLQRLPKGLKGTYSIIWDKICGQSEENELLARRTLKWIMCAQSPLTEPEIIDAVTIEPMDFTVNQNLRGPKVQDLLDVCQNLIVIDKQLGVLRTAHFSVNEFLEDHIKMTEAHNHASEICLTLMRHPKIYNEPPMKRLRYYFENFYEDQNPTPRPNISDALEPHPLRYYMFDHWAYHLRFSGDASNSLLQYQKEFFNASSIFYKWLQVAGEQWEVFRPMEWKGKLTPFWVASYYQLWAICKNLLKSNVDNCAVRNVGGQTPVHWAAHFGNEEMVQLLLEKEGIDINPKNRCGSTPLFAAARRGHESVVRLLLKKEGIDINPKDEDGETPLFAAASGGHESVVGLLLEKEGIDINPKDYLGRTPLQIARPNRYGAVAQLLENRIHLEKARNDETHGKAINSHQQSTNDQTESATAAPQITPDPPKSTPAAPPSTHADPPITPAAPPRTPAAP
ncbi:hypothetical protein RUND412_009377 [Rhizina undulata]